MADNYEDMPELEEVTRDNVVRYECITGWLNVTGTTFSGCGNNYSRILQRYKPKIVYLTMEGDSVPDNGDLVERARLAKEWLKEKRNKQVVVEE